MKRARQNNTGNDAVSHTSLLFAAALILASPGLHSSSANTQTSFDYNSSVDGAALHSSLHLPTGFDPDGARLPLVVQLHSGGGLGRIVEADEMDARHWLQIAPDGRAWGLAQQGCPWQTSAAYVNSFDPNVGPGEQDVLDAIDWAIANLPVDEKRIYLMGFGDGGRGAYSIGLKNADRFAALFPGAPSIDTFERFARDPQRPTCLTEMLGGAPGDSLLVDTMYSVTSARFLIENAYNLPIFHGHGLRDTIANNDAGNGRFLHGWHITTDNTFGGCHGPNELCFGHTPTLAKLHANAPGGYDWAFLFSAVGHVSDSRWALGASAGPLLIGVPDALNPGQLQGAFDFFAARSLQVRPETVVFKTYENQHQESYWLELQTATPWLNRPAAVRARRDPPNNRIEAEFVRAAELRFDLVQSELALGATQPLTLELDVLDEPTYDPALSAAGEALVPMMILRGEFESIVGVTVVVDGQPFSPDLLTVHPDEIRIGPLSVDGPRRMEIAAIERYCTGAPNSFGGGAEIGYLGDASLRANRLQLVANGVVPGAFGLFFYGPGSTERPFGDGHLCIAGGLHRLRTGSAADAFGDVQVAVDFGAAPMASGAGRIDAGDVWSFQFWYRDVAAGAAGFNTSDALKVSFLP